MLNWLFERRTCFGLAFSFWQALWIIVIPTVVGLAYFAPQSACSERPTVAEMCRYR